MLLIVSILSDNQLLSLFNLIQSLGMEVLVEISNESELQRALLLPTLRLLGINNRNLASFHVDKSTVCQLAPLIPHSIIVVALSGIESSADLQRYKGMVGGVLVGENLMRAKVPQKFIDSLYLA